MAERAYVISKINEAANEIMSSLPLCDRRVDINGIIISAMRGDNYVERNNRNEVVAEWISVFNFVNERFGRTFDMGDKEARKSLETLLAKSLEIDRMIQVYLTL